MQKKTDKFLDKIVKKDYSNELEKVLEGKYFDENAKNLLLNIVYKIGTAYKDYETAKVNVPSKEDFIQSIIEIVKNDCDNIKIVKLHTEESEMLGKKTFLVERNQKRIICYPIEKKLLYCLAKIDKKEKIVKSKYPIIDKTLSHLINIGNNIDMTEAMRDFNGYSWTTIPREIESVYHNIVYQNIRILVGHKFLQKWIQNNEYIMDYYESFNNKLEKSYGKRLQEEFTEEVNKVSVLLSIRYEEKIKNSLKKQKREIETKLEKIQDDKKLIEDITEQKKQIAKEIKYIDETLNNKDMLQKEYEKRNEYLPLQEKIFSIRILSKIMMEEREEKIKQLEKWNTLLNPQKFVAYKKELETKDKYLKLLDVEDFNKAIEDSILTIQKIFLLCYQNKVKKAETKQELIKLIYEFRYYCLLPFNQEKLIYDMEEIKEEVSEVQKLLISKAHEHKMIETFSKDKEIDFQILKNIFYIRVINLEDLYIKFIKEKEQYYVQLFDENVFEEKVEIKGIDEFDKKDLHFKFNKKIKIFN